MGEETTTLGTIHISPSALATIAYHATLSSYGVVGLAPKNLAEGLAMSITHEPARGVSVNYNDEEINIDVHIIIEYGTRITSVADSVANAVRYQVEKALGMPIHHVNVHIQGLRISNPDECEEYLEVWIRMFKRGWIGFDPCRLMGRLSKNLSRQD